MPPASMAVIRWIVVALAVLPFALPHLRADWPKLRSKPGLTVLFFVTLMAVWSLISGVLMIVAAFKLNPTYGRGWLIFSGIVSVLFGIALLLAPLVGAVVLTWWLGAYALVFGISLIVLAFKLKGHKGETGTATPMTA